MNFSKWLVCKMHSHDFETLGAFTSFDGGKDWDLLRCRYCGLKTKKEVAHITGAVCVDLTALYGSDFDKPVSPNITRLH